MKERPILFNADMVRAILDGRKTQTRRIMKVQPESSQFGIRRVIASTEHSDIGKYHWSCSNALGSHVRSKLFAFPLGQVGDRLWVRETWGDMNLEGIPAVAFRADGGVYSPMDDESFLDEDGYFNYYDPRVAKYDFTTCYPDLINGVDGLWRPSVHMPRWASRITLEITGVRVERLQDISEEDAKAEGVTRIENNYGNGPAYCDYLLPDLNDTAEWCSNAKRSFQSLWRSIYGPENWHLNPYVWCVDFKRLEAE